MQKSTLKVFFHTRRYDFWAVLTTGLNVHLKS